MGNLINTDQVIMVDEDGDYTIKTYQREDCKYYCIIVKETDEDSIVVARTKNQNSWAKAKEDAKSVVLKDKMSV